MRLLRATHRNIYVASRASGERVMASISAFLSRRLKLTVNRKKSAVDRPWNRIFLGYSMTFHRKPRLKVGKKSVERVKATIREACRRGKGQRLGTIIKGLGPKLRGWVNYFRYSEVKGLFEELDGWVRRKLRCILWRQWKRTYTRARNLIRFGLPKETALKSAMNGRGPWWNAGAAHMHKSMGKSFFERLGLVSLMTQYHRLQAVS